MSISSTSIELARRRLEKLSLPSLKEEAMKYGIKLSTEIHERWVDAIVDHLTRNNPKDNNMPQMPETCDEPNSPESAAGNIKVSSAPEIFLFDAGKQTTADKSYVQPDSLIIEQFRLQREQMSQQMKILQQMSQQQATFQQLFTSLCINQGSQRNYTYLDESKNQSSTQVPQAQQVAQVPEPQQVNQIPEISVAATGQAVKFLSSQIPTFGGTEEEDIEIWIEKIEYVAEIHNLSQVVMLAAATSKVNKTAKRWLDLNTGEVNRSWISFKFAIIDHLKKNSFILSCKK